MRDEIFKKPISKQFEFDESVATVFDDMISRSVPYYQIVLDLTSDFLNRYLKDESQALDLGCSTGTTLFKLLELNKTFKLKGVDNSKPMLEIARNKANAYGVEIEFILGDILEVELKNSDAIILNYTLQFIRPLLRESFVKKIYENLNEGGVFVLSEKILFEDKKVAVDIIEIYEEYKEKQGYSKYEIAQKRQALENVLIPYSEDENKTMLKNAGFRSVESLFKWGNFATFIALK